MKSSTPVIFIFMVMALFASLEAAAADPVRYRVDLAATGDGALDATLRASSELVSLRDNAPVSPVGLITRGRGDIERLKTVLESYGYYRSAVTLTIDGSALNSAELADALSALPKGSTAKVALSFTLGPLYHVRTVSVDGSIPQSAAGAFALQSGAPAVAADILAAGTRLQAALEEQGYAFAQVDAPVAYEDRNDPVLDVSFRVKAGEPVNIGEIRLEGLERVHEKLVRRRLTIHTGERYRASAIDAARFDLLRMGPFGAVSVQLGSAADATGGVPVTFVLHERKRHAVALSAAYSNDLGGSGGITWSDRNVFGNAEQLSITARVLDLGGSNTQGIGYDTNAAFTLPDFGHRDQSLKFSVGAIKQYLEAYDQTALTTGVTLSRRLSTVWTVSAGVTTARETILQNAITYHYTLVALPVTAGYDSTNLASPLDDPTHGMRDSLSVTPTQSLGNANATFIVSYVKVATYFDLHALGLADPGRSVLAGLIQGGKAQGAGEFSLPPDQRFYAGGSGTIRGYPYQTVGPIFPNTQIPIGGTDVVAGSLEFRQRFGASWGGAWFVDGGKVSANASAASTIVPQVKTTTRLNSSIELGVGMGVRYYTGIGPIRFDLAVPMQNAITGQAFQVYIGLGQAF